MERLQQASHAKRFDQISSETQEDHRSFADVVVSLLRGCRWPSEDSKLRPELERLVDPVLLVYFPDLRRERSEKARIFLQSLRPL
jgi:hypothetical protein